MSPGPVPEGVSSAAWRIASVVASNPSTVSFAALPESCGRAGTCSPVSVLIGSRFLCGMIGLPENQSARSSSVPTLFACHCWQFLLRRNLGRDSRVRSKKLGDLHHGLIRAYLLRWRWNNLRHSRGGIRRRHFDGKFHGHWHFCAEAYKFGTSSRCTCRISKLCRTRVAGGCAGSHRTHPCAFASALDTSNLYIRSSAPKTSRRTFKNPS